MAEPSLPSGMVTFLLTDVEGSTRIWEADRSRARVAFERHDALVAEHLASFGGGRPRDQGEGDSAFAVFARASEALGCALALQRAMFAEPWPEDATIRVRMALHTGEAELSKGNYKGSAVHRCARLRGLAHGGQIVLSESTAQIVRDQLAGDVTLRDMGVHELRGLLHPEHVYQLCHPELPTDFPPLQSGSGRPRDLLVGGQVPMPAPSDRVPGLAQPGWSDADAERFRLFEAVATFLMELRVGAPALLVIDDLHWADRATLLLVRHLARHADLAGLVVLATCRDER